MNKEQLLDKLREKFSSVLTVEEGATEGDVKHWQVPVVDIVDDTMKRQWVHFYTQGTDAYWQGGEPKAEVVVSPNFIDRVEAFVVSKIEEGVIKFGYVKETNERAKKALVTAITSDNTEVQAIVSEEEVGNFSIELL